jgi:hypothetical protein
MPRMQIRHVIDSPRSTRTTMYVVLDELNNIVKEVPHVEKPELEKEL